MDENGEIDEGAATDTWTVDCLDGGGTIDKQAELEATEKALDSLVAHGVVEEIPDDTMGEGLAHERRRVEDEGTVCGTRGCCGRILPGS